MTKLCNNHICHIEFGIWDLGVLWDLEFGGAKSWGDTLVTIWGGNASHKWGMRQFEWGRGGSHYVITLHWNFIVSLTGYCKRFNRIHPFPMFLVFGLFCIYHWDWQSQKYNLKCPKVYEINPELYCNCNCCLNPFLWYKYYYSKNLTGIHLLQLKIRNIWLKFFWNQNICHWDIKEISTLKQVIRYIIFNKIVC